MLGVGATELAVPSVPAEFVVTLGETCAANEPESSASIPIGRARLCGKSKCVGRSGSEQRTTKCMTNLGIYDKNNRKFQEKSLWLMEMEMWWKYLYGRTESENRSI